MIGDYRKSDSDAQHRRQSLFFSQSFSCARPIHNPGRISSGQHPFSFYAVFTLRVERRSTHASSLRLSAAESFREWAPIPFRMGYL